MDLSEYDRFMSPEGEILLHPEELVDALLSLFLGNSNLNITVKVESLQYPGYYHFLTFKRLYIPPEITPPEMAISQRLAEQRNEMIESIRAEWGPLEESDSETEIEFEDAFGIVQRNPFVVPEGMPFDFV
ncbi:hypothetical protein CJU89_5108 [Yarrowia sp. B02]|nr:hypothetical protein CJU89_5108 [Yarrowia sp. B02]